MVTIVSRRITFLTRPGCGVCGQAAPKVARIARLLRCQLEFRDITKDPPLEDEFHLRIPVLLDEAGSVIAEGALTGWGTLRALLRSRFTRD